jgi:hypothetical protein
MSEDHLHLHLEEAIKLYQKAIEEFEKAKEKKDGMVLRDACGKGWLSTVEATYAILVKKGVKEEELPRTDRGRRFMVNKYAERELRLYYFSLRDNLHVVGYYDGTLDFDEMGRYLDDLNLYIHKVEEIK